MRAAQWGHLACMKILLERGFEVNARDGDGRTTLSQAGGKDVGLSLARRKDIEEIEKVFKAHSGNE